MKHVLKSLKHNGIYVPQYDYKQFKVKIRGETIPLSPKSEQMAVVWIRKRQSALSPPDKVFMRNFMREFLEQLKQENPSSETLKSFAPEYLRIIEDYEANDIYIPSAPIHGEIDFSEIVNYVEGEKQKKKKRKKRKRERERKEKKKKKPQRAPPPPFPFFAGRGDHPQRGKWKE